MSNETTKFKCSTGPFQMQGFLFEGIAVHFTHDGKEVILISPTETELAYFYSRVSAKIIDRQYTRHGYFGTVLPIQGATPKREEVKNTTKTLHEIWICHAESGCAFRGYREFDIPGHDGMCFEVGEVQDKTVQECKVLLRRLGWPREDINNLEIHSNDPDIPF